MVILDELVCFEQAISAEIRRCVINGVQDWKYIFLHFYLATHVKLGETLPLTPQPKSIETMQKHDVLQCVTKYELLRVSP